MSHNMRSISMTPTTPKPVHTKHVLCGFIMADLPVSTNESQQPESQNPRAIEDVQSRLQHLTISENQPGSQGERKQRTLTSVKLCNRTKAPLPYIGVNEELYEPTLYCHEYCGHPTEIDITVLFTGNSIRDLLASGNVTPTSDPKCLVITYPRWCPKSLEYRSKTLRDLIVVDFTIKTDAPKRLEDYHQDGWINGRINGMSISISEVLQL
jgi:hypothetical protein